MARPLHAPVADLDCVMGPSKCSRPVPMRPGLDLAGYRDLVCRIEHAAVQALGARDDHARTIMERTRCGSLSTDCCQRAPLSSNLFGSTLPADMATKPHWAPRHHRRSSQVCHVPRPANRLVPSPNLAVFRTSSSGDVEHP